MDHSNTNSAETADNENHVDAPLNRRLFKKRWAVWMVLLIGLGPYLYYRATSFGRKIQTFELSSDSVQNGLQNGPANGLASSTGPFSGSLRVATWNIAHGRGTTSDNWSEGRAPKQDRIKEISDFIHSIDADLVVLNEVDFNATWSGGYNQAEAIARQSGYPYYVCQSNLDFGFVYGRWHFGNVLLSRFPIEHAKVVEFAPQRIWEPWVVGCKRGFECGVKISDLKSISIIGLHLESRSEAVRVAEVGDVSSAAAKITRPLIIAGDLNTTPGYAPHSRQDAEGKNAFEELVETTEMSFLPDSDPTSRELTFSAMQPKSVIDWILFQEPAFQLKTQTVLQTQLSDHLPIVAEFDFTGGEPANDNGM